MITTLFTLLNRDSLTSFHSEGDGRTRIMPGGCKRYPGHYVRSIA
jgi:hypothetical protein